MKNYWKLKLNKAHIIAGIVFFYSSLIFAQTVLTSTLKAPSSKVENYYMFPIRPGETNYLAGTMGELRASHFHGGIDIKTSGREGLNVYAAASGYVSRIAVSAGGYGNAIYILHPNGETTVYAHLSKFKDDLAEFVRNKQYKQKSFVINVFPEPNQFVVKKGDIIALSGNSGGSSGPHLHFEIRDRNQDLLDPLAYGFSEIKDTIAPATRFVSINCLDINARVNGQYGNFQFAVSKNGNSYQLDKPINVQGKIGIDLMTYDQLNGVNNKNGVPNIRLSLDGRPIYNQTLSTFAFSESRNILVHTNFEAKANTGKTYNRLYISDGNELSFYDKSLGDGFINIQDTLTHNVLIETSDKYENQSTVEFQIKGEIFAFGHSTKISSYKKTPLYVTNNTLIINADLTNDSTQFIDLFANRQVYKLKPNYLTIDKAVYLWDLRNGLPDSINICDEMVDPHLTVMVPSNKKFDFYNKWIDISFHKRTLFDTLYLQLEHFYSEDSIKDEYFRLSGTMLPFRSNATISLQPKTKYVNKSNTFVYSVYNGYFNFIGGVWKSDGISFKTRSLGLFTLVTDSIAPSIRPVRVNKNIASFIIDDQLSGIKKYTAYLDGKWVLMNYDYKKKVIWSEKKDDRIPFNGDFTLVVEDKAGNKQTYKTTL